MTGKNALIHIGGNKTGSTAIQEALATAAMRCGLDKVCYPELDSISKCQHFLDVFYGEESSAHPHLKYIADRFCFNIAALYQKYQAVLLGTDNVIISSEMLSGFNRDRVRLLKRDLDAAGYSNYQVVVYVREPISHYISFLQEILKQSRVCAQPSWHQYLGHMKQAILVFSEVFDCDICVREFDRKQLVGGDVVLDFSAIASAFFDTEITLQSVAVSESNVSLTAEAAFILHEYRSAPPYSVSDERIFFPEVESLYSQLSEHTGMGSKIVLRPEIAAYIAEQNVQDAEWFKLQYGVDFSARVTPAGAIRLNEPLRLEDIIVRPKASDIDELRKRVRIPLAVSTDRTPDNQSCLLAFIQDSKYRRKVFFGGGSVFHEAMEWLWLLQGDLKFDDITFVDRRPAIKRVRDWTFSFVHPDEVDWAIVEAAMICTPAYESEVRQYLFEKNSELHVSGMLM
jgi:hypothetical protein